MGVRNGNYHASLSFHSDMDWSNLDLDWDVGRLQLGRNTVPEEPGIWSVQIQLGQVIEMFQRSLFRHFDDGATNLDMAERLRWIRGRQRHFWVGPHVLFFANPAHGVAQRATSLPRAPDGGRLPLPPRPAAR